MPEESDQSIKKIVFPLNTVTSSFALPNNFNVEKFLEKLSHSEEKEFESGTKKMVFLVTESEKESLLSICLCYGSGLIEEEVLELFPKGDSSFKIKFSSMIAEMDKSRSKGNYFYEAFRTNAKILGQAYTFIKPQMDTIDDKKLKEVFVKMINSSELLFGAKIRYFDGSKRSSKQEKYGEHKPYHIYKREFEEEEVKYKENSSYLIIDKTEKDLWNVGVIEFEDVMFSTCEEPSFISPYSDTDTENRAIEKIEYENNPDNRVIECEINLDKVKEKEDKEGILSSECSCRLM